MMTEAVRLQVSKKTFFSGPGAIFGETGEVAEKLENFNFKHPALKIEHRFEPESGIKIAANGWEKSRSR